ncbi:hypothetical protein BSL78_28970 [Apostichopus japonicus]|uniref:Uncharacterized protein n=1 Tax=Stichopus japonicus TaxID=307972 RepID=A0A2G8JEQ4_STIJA|nr:hypothetical protein BSL78_28970 [Apostichopus japonicus]
MADSDDRTRQRSGNERGRYTHNDVHSRRRGGNSGRGSHSRGRGRGEAHGTPVRGQRGTIPMGMPMLKRLENETSDEIARLLHQNKRPLRETS